jgi:hypothetical protein
MRLGNGVGFRLVRREDGLELRNAQHIVDLWRHGADAQRAGPVLRTREITNEKPEAAAVDEVDAAKMQDEMAIERDQHVQCVLQRGGLLAGGDSSGTRDHRGIAHATIG